LRAKYGLTVENIVAKVKAEFAHAGTPALELTTMGK
jgi:hypothetical protein